MGTRKQQPLDKIRGIIDIDAGGETYTLKFGINAMCFMDELIGEVTAEKIHSYEGFRAMVWSGMVCGAHFRGTPFEVDIWGVGDIIDLLTQEDRQAILAAFFEAQPQKASEQKKK